MSVSAEQIAYGAVHGNAVELQAPHRCLETEVAQVHGEAFSLDHGASMSIFLLQLKIVALMCPALAMLIGASGQVGTLKACIAAL